MATRSFIGKLNSDGSVNGIYCHWDGYPDHNGKILQENYLDPVKVDALLALGSLSSLGTEIGEKHDFNDQTNAAFCKAYHRDRGEDFEENTVFPSVTEMQLEANNKLGVEYAYVFADGKWQTFEL